MADYIERKRLKEAISEDCQHLSCFDESFFDMVMINVDNIAAADVRPVVHAQWKDGLEIKVFKEEKIPTVQCPKCLLYFGDLLNNHREIYRFCPYCGAQMDGGTGNER